MDNQLSDQSVNQVVPTPPIPDQGKPQVHHRFSSFLIVIALILFGILIGVVAARFIPLPIASVPIPTPTPTVELTPSASPEPSLTPVPSIHPLIDATETATWKTFVNPVYSFKYPSSWKVNGNQLTSATPKITILAYPPDDSMMNECMEITETKTFGDLMVKKYSRVVTGEACSGGDATSKELWITKSGGDGYAPGIQFQYSSREAVDAEKIFNLLLSSFKYTSGKTSSYSCPKTPYVDCMPGPNTGIKLECTSEYLNWANTNCPGFQGAAY